MLATVLRWMGLLVLVFLVGNFFAILLLYVLAFRGRPKPSTLVAAFCKEYLATCVLFPSHLLVPLGAFYPRHGRGKGRAASPPVVMVHGFGLTRNTFLFLGPKLTARGLGPLHALTYDSLAGIEEGARAVERFVESVCRRHGCERVDLVSHSWGGPVSRWYVERLGGARRVRRLVSLAPPFHGTLQSRLALGRTRTDIAVNSEVLQELGEPPRGTSYASIASTTDEAIVPPGSAFFEPYGAIDLETELATLPPLGRSGGPRTRQLVIPGLGHASLCFAGRVADEVTAFLRAPEPTPGGGGSGEVGHDALGEGA